MIKTLDNLIYLFLHESQMRCLHELFENKAQKEGYTYVKNIFAEKIQQKLEHICWIFFMIEKIEQSKENEKPTTPFDKIPSIGNTFNNLQIAIEKEKYDKNVLYPHYIKVATEEGYNEISKRLKFISNRIKENINQFKLAQELITDNQLLKSEEIPIWECKNCGFQVSRKFLPDDWVCPSCGHLKPYFKEITLTREKDEGSRTKSGWECMECGETVILDELPDNWVCSSCGRPKEYFRRKTLSIPSPILPEERDELVLWECMECGNEVRMPELPKDWNCIYCGKPSTYFKRKRTIPTQERYVKQSKTKTLWICTNCGHSEEINMPSGWKCPACGQ